MDCLPVESLACPSCRRTMVSLCIGAVPVGHLALDYCVTCRGLWFDPHESTRLAPASILELFRIIHDARESATQPIASNLVCPRCAQALLVTKDLVLGGPIAYHRCPYGHGRFTPFAQFLTEKGFVRYLAKAERAKLAVSIRQINCHACGGPIDLRSDMACPHCRSPIAVLDSEAMAKAFAGYSQAAIPRIREMTGSLSVAVRRFPFLPQRRGTSLLELGISAMAELLP